MARPALTDDAIEAFRERLCELAMRRFAEDGFGAVSLRALARELGVSHPMMYRYVVDKDHLFAEVRLRSFARFIAYNERRMAAQPDARSALLEGARAYVDFAAEEPHAFRVMFDLSQPRLEAYPALASAHRRAFRLLKRVVVRAIMDGVVAGEPGAVTRQLWAAVHGVAALLTSGSLPGRTAQQLAVSVAESLIAGLAPRRNP